MLFGSPAFCCQGMIISMTEMYVVDSSSFARTTMAETSMVANVLSVILIIGFPTAFWMAVLEAANRLFALELSMTTRLAVAAILVVVLSVVWCFAVLSARQN